VAEPVAQRTAPADIAEAKPVQSTPSFVSPEPTTSSSAATGSTGSLFFVAGEDTPASVTRSLFDPVSTPKPAVEADSLAAHNDDEKPDDDKPSASDQENTKHSA
jgi:ribonuclease E